MVGSPNTPQKSEAMTHCQSQFWRAMCAPDRCSRIGDRACASRCGTARTGAIHVMLAACDQVEAIASLERRIGPLRCPQVRIIENPGGARGPTGAEPHQAHSAVGGIACPAGPLT